MLYHYIKSVGLIDIKYICTLLLLYVKVNVYSLFNYECFKIHSSTDGMCWDFFIGSVHSFPLPF